MPTTIGATGLTLQPDHEWSLGPDGDAVVVNYKGSYNDCIAEQPEIGDTWIDSDVDGLQDGLEVFAARVRNTGSGEAVLTVECRLDVKEELSWIAVNKPITRHPKVVAASISDADLSKVETALRDPRNYATSLSGASAAAQYLYSVRLGGTDSWQTQNPVIIKTVKLFCNDTFSKMGSTGKEISAGNYEETPVLTYIIAPTQDYFGNAFTYIRQPDTFPVENGIVTLRRSWIGFIGVYSWMYGTGNFPPGP